MLKEVLTSVVYVNGLGLVNVKLCKSILYLVKQCKCKKKVKTIFICSPIKQCKYITMWKMWFLLEEGRFHNVFEDKPAKWPIAKKKKKNHQNIQPQLIHMTLQEGLIIKDI